MTLEPAILSIGDEARTPDDFRHGLIAILSLSPETASSDIAELLRCHGGVLAALQADGAVLTFPRLQEAAIFARALQTAARAGAGPRPAVGINLGAPRLAADGQGGTDVAFAHALRRRAAPGEILISAVTGDRLTSRIRAEGPNEPPGWRGWILPTIGLAGFLGYFFGWFYAIYWKLEGYATTGSFACWPEWLCR